MIPIIAPPSAPHALVRDNAGPEVTRAIQEAINKGKVLEDAADYWFIELALPALWEAGLRTGVDPVVLAAQCAHETGWGTFIGKVNWRFGNTCGMKNVDATGDLPSDHAHFAIDPHGRPRIGALAHAHHLMLYAGFRIPEDSPDPRAKFIVTDPNRFGEAQYVEQLSGKWAFPGLEYGIKVANIYHRLTQQ